MPRRPSKARGGRAAKPKPVNRGESKQKRWNTVEDIPMDEQDQFHASRDRILLEGEDDGADDDDDEDEVFGLKGLSGEESDDEEESGDLKEEHDEEEAAPPPKKKKKENKSKVKQAPEASPASSESESEEEAWGRNKSAYYSSNAADLESDDEEAHELEEQEAKRLQAKVRDAMGEEDFGLLDPVELSEMRFDEDDMLEAPTVNVQALPQNKQALIRHLEKTNPEVLALARDWEETAWNLMRCQAKLKHTETETPDALSLGMTHLHYQTLLTYATTLAFYLHIRANEKYARRPDLLKSHPVMARLLTLKQSLATLEELDFAPSDDGSDADDEDDEENGGSLDLCEYEESLDREQLWKLASLEGLDADELEDLLEDAELPLAKQISPTSPPTVKRPKKKQKLDKTDSEGSSLLPIFDLVEPEYSRPKTSAAISNSDFSADAYGEATSLQHADQADKNARRKTLRFHTSKIESASARRQGARNRAAGGDDDIPYRERRKEKDARMAKESSSEKRVKERGQGGDDLDDVEPDINSKKRRREDEDGDGDGDGDEEGADGYYELVRRKAKEKKEKKKTDYEELTAAARPIIEDDVAKGPRSLTRAILANKGLTPHRSKSVRNPRVKKRQKYDKAKKKVSSQKATYKGGIGDSGRYDGEKSGISKVVKSVRLG